MCAQFNPAFLATPLLKIYPQTRSDLQSLASFSFKDITEEELAVMVACCLSQIMTPNISDPVAVGSFFDQLSTCLHFKFNLRKSANCTPMLLEFFSELKKLYL